MQIQPDIAYSTPQDILALLETWEDCMLGGIYTSEKCAICGEKLKHVEAKGVRCPNHPQVVAQKMRVHFRGVKRRFSNGRYRSAYKFLCYLRGAVDSNHFDPRDYRRDNPLGFSGLVEEFLTAKRHIKAIQSYRCRLEKAVEVFEGRSIKEINNVAIARLVASLQDRYSSYYVKIINDLLKSFWKWTFDMGYLRYGVDPLPQFPRIQYEMAFRKIVDAETQEKILEQIHKDVWDTNPRIYMAINMLRTYLHVRPMELMGCNEEHLNLQDGILIIPTSKERKVKLIRLCEDDIAFFQSLPRGVGKLPLFRYDKGAGSQRSGNRFGCHVLLNAWSRACAKVDVKGVSLYGGTRHSTATALGRHHSPERIKALTGHATSKAFERYFTMPDERIQELYAEIRGGKERGKILSLPVKDK